MVMSRNRQATREELEGMADMDSLTSEEQDQLEQEEQKTHWKKATPVRINSIALTPELFEGEPVEHQSKGNKKHPEGLITVLDEDYVRYRIGSLLVSVEEKMQALAEDNELQGYILDSIAFYREYAEEKETAQREAKREEILEKASKKYERIKGFLIAANPQMKKMSKEQMITWIADNMEL